MPTPVFFLTALSLSDVRICASFIGLGPFRLWRLAHWVSGWRGAFWKNTNEQSVTQVSGAMSVVFCHPGLEPFSQRA